MKFFIQSFLAIMLLVVLASACSSQSPAEPEPVVEEPEGTPPKTWTEHWGDHDHLTLKRVFYDDNVAIYFDDQMNPSITWPNTVLAKMWVYVKSQYGDFGTDPRLYAVFHGYEYSGGHADGFTGPGHDYRNTIDMGGSKQGLNAWINDNYQASYGVPFHETGHVVEGNFKGVNGSPAWDVWGDSKWCEIFNYDVCLGLGLTDAAQGIYDELIDKMDDFPRAGTYWFRDWFYPVYTNYGKTKVLVKFFDLLVEHFPKQSTNTALTGQEYSRRMNHGEFVHFWSGAAGVNLKPLAEKAFGWPYEYEAQFNKAREDFPGITYPDPL